MYQLIQENSGFNYKSYVGMVRNMYQKPVAKTSSSLILTLLTIAFFGFAAIRPTLATVSELVGELEEKRELEQKVDQKIQSLAAAQDNYVNNQDILQTFDQTLPPSPQTTELLFIIEYLGYQNNIDIISIRHPPITIYGQPSTIDSKEAQTFIQNQFVAINFRLTAEGEIPNLLSFVRDLSQHNRLLHIESTSLNQPEEDQGQEETKPIISIFFTTYYNPPTNLNPNQSSPPGSPNPWN